MIKYCLLACAGFFFSDVGPPLDKCQTRQTFRRQVGEVASGALGSHCFSQDATFDLCSVLHIFSFFHVIQAGERFG